MERATSDDNVYITNFIKRVKASAPKLFQNQVEEIKKWSRVPHNKTGLELFLANTIAEIWVNPNDLRNRSIRILSSNIDFVKEFTRNSIYRIKSPVAIVAGGDPFKSKKADIVLSWDLVKQHFSTIKGDQWQIMNFIVISKENVLPLWNIVRQLVRTSPNAELKR